VDFPAQFVVTFSADVPKYPTPDLVWFIVTLEYRPPSGMQALTPPVVETVRLAGTVELVGNRATFFGNRFNAALPRRSNVEQRVLCRVVVKCDILLDGNGLAVDGDHLGGMLPSGDGVPGGDFESWFVVKVPRG
jgi:hypothetical protein